MSSRDSDAPAVTGDPLRDTGGLAARRAAPDSGASAIEYALLLGLIALVIFATMMLLGVNVADFYSSVATGY